MIAEELLKLMHIKMKKQKKSEANKHVNNPNGLPGNSIKKIASKFNILDMLAL